MHPLLCTSAVAVLLLGGLCLTPASGVEFQIPSAPLDVRPEMVGDRPVTWVEWGVSGPAKRRNPVLIREEQESLEQFLRSPELAARMVVMAGEAKTKTAAMYQRTMSKWMMDYATVEQPTAFARRVGVTVDELPTPLWAHGIPADVRSGLQVLFFDDRDPVQRAWVINRRKTQTYYTMAYCTGWRSGKDRDDFWRNQPGGPIAPIPIAADQFVDFYQVSSFPAAITFKGAEVMIVEQGMDQ